MSTQNGVSDTTSTTKRFVFLRSMRLRVFLIVVLSGIILSVTFTAVARTVVRNRTIESKLSDVRDYSGKIIAGMVTDVYTVHPSQTPDITKELDTVAVQYEGRIIVTDYNLSIIYDSFGIETGKTLVSAETLRALRGASSEFRDKDAEVIELTLPIMEKRDSASASIQNMSEYDITVQGVMIVVFSVSDCLELTGSVSRSLIITAILEGLMFVAVAVFAARILTKPFNRINQSLHHVSEGYVDDKVDIGGYSEMDRISDSFNEMLRQISRLEQSRQEFVSNVSHELKTPLTSMKVLADSLVQQPDAPAELYREFMTDINAEIDRENKIITDLLALVKLDRKSGDMHIAQVSINELLDIIFKRLKPIAQVAGVELILETYRDVLAEVDEVKLTLAITNLIENAIKYNKENGTVRVVLNADHRSFLVTVSDTGIGIPREHLGMIFDRFYRVDKMRSRETGGTGLGLAIAKSVVLMHHGIIKVDSTEGVGTTFSIKIPLSYINNDR